MKYILNITFAEAHAETVLHWLKENGRRTAVAATAPSAARLLRVADVPGDPDFLKEGGSISLQLDFPRLEDARSRLEDCLAELAEGYMAEFGRQPLFFATILEETEE